MINFRKGSGQNFWNPHPAIAITAHRDRYTAERVTEFGFEAFLMKPVDPFDLFRTGASLVGR